MDNIFKEMFIERQNRKPAWHGLGQVFGKDEHIDLVEGLRRIGGDIRIVTAPQMFEYEGQMHPTGDRCIIRLPRPEHNEGVMSFGSASDNWEPVQNVDLVNWFNPASRDFLLETMGVLDQGKIFFFTMRDEGFDILSNGKWDQHEGYLYVADWKAPGKSLLFGAGDTRIVCYNTFLAAIKKARAIIPITHHKGANEIAEYIAKALAQAGSMRRALRDAHQMLANKAMSIEDAKETFEVAWPTPQMPKIVASLDSLSKPRTVEFSGQQGDSRAQGIVKEVLSLAGLEGLQDQALRGDIQDMTMSSGVQGRRDQSFKVWEDTCERHKGLRDAAEVSLMQMADGEGLGLNGYTTLQAVIETVQHRNGARGEVERNAIFGGGAAIVNRVSKHLGLN